MLTQEQASAIKKQVIKHIEKDFPEEKKDFAIKQITAMNPEELEEFSEPDILNPLARTSPQSFNPLLV